MQFVLKMGAQTSLFPCSQLFFGTMIHIGGASVPDQNVTCRSVKGVSLAKVSCGLGGHMTNPRFALGVVVLVLAGSAPVWGQEAAAVGRIKVVSGSAFIVRQSATIPAELGQMVFETDGLRTGADGRIGVTLKDDTRVSLGPNSEARIDRFVYAPADGRLGFVFNIVRGVAAYVSGQIAKLAPDSIRLETPAAIVGVRGTSLAVRVEP